MAQKEYVPFEMDLNLDEVEAWSGEDRPLLPVGTYHVKINNFENVEGKWIAVEFEVLEGEQAGGRCWNNYNLGNKVGIARLKQLAIACGASMSRINSDEFLGAQLYVDVIHNEGAAKPDAMGNPMKPRTFANVQNERAQLGEGESLGAPNDAINADDGEADPPPPPITKETPAPKPEPAKAEATGNNAARRGRRA